MTASDLLALLPIIVLGALPVVLILAIAAPRDAHLTLGLTLAGLARALAALVPAARAEPAEVTPLLLIDGPALAFTVLAALAGAATVLLAHAAAPPGGARWSAPSPTWSTRTPRAPCWPGPPRSGPGTCRCW